MKKIKKFVTILLSLTMLLSLSACGSKEPTKHEVNMGSYTVKLLSLDYSLEDYLKTGETIWFEFDNNKGKDTIVDKIYVMEKDGTMYVAGSGSLYRVFGTQFKLGDLEQMEDGAIAKMVKEAYPDYIAWDYASDMLESNDREKEISGLYAFLDGFKNPAYFIYEPWSMTKEELLQRLQDSNFGDHAIEAIGNHWDEINAYYTTFSEFASAASGFARGEEVLIQVCDTLVRGEGEKKTTSQVMEYIQQNAPKCVETAQNMDIDAVVQAHSKLGDVAEAIYTEMETWLEAEMKNMAPAQYKLALVTDSTGNNTAKEQIVYRYVFNGQETIRTVSLTYGYPIDLPDGTTTNCTTQVYDSYYGGYISNDSVFYTRVENRAHFILDQMGDSKLPFDVEAKESLFG